MNGICQEKEKNNMSKILTGIPSLLGVVLGVWLYSSDNFAYWFYVLAVFIFSIVFLFIGRYLVKSAPMISVIFIELWVIAPIILVAISTAVIVWITIKSPSWFSGSETEVNAVTGAFIGAITAYLAAAWTDDIASGDGIFWPSTQIKQAFLKFELIGDTLERQAAQDMRVHEKDIEGWGVLASWKRAAILAEYVKKVHGNQGDMNEKS